MTNNYIFRRLQFIFRLSDKKMIELFKLAGQEVTLDQVKLWAKRDEDPDVLELSDFNMAAFLNGWIIENRGKKEGPQPIPESKLNNNLMLRKVRIALNFKDEDMLEVFNLTEMKLSKHELSAFFRKPDHKHYRECKDQFLRNFVHGLSAKYRDTQ